jgi:hypothetical protein
MRSSESTVLGRQGQEYGSSARAVLAADAVWDALVGIALIVAAVGSATRPLGAGALRPWPLPVVLGIACLAVSVLLLHASAGTQAPDACRLIWPGNAAGTIAGVALLLAFPHLAHPYVVALAIASIGCAVFAILERVAT